MNVKNNAILKEFTQLPVSALTPKSSSIRRSTHGLVGVKEQLEEKGGESPACLSLSLWVSTLLTENYTPWPPVMGLFCNWEEVNRSLRKFLTKGLRKSESSLQPFKPACSVLSLQNSGPGARRPGFHL